MSSVIVITPILVAGWPAITAAVTAAIGALGFAQLHGSNSSAKNASVVRAVVEVAQSEVLAGVAGEDARLVVERDGVCAVIRRDERGALRLCLEGVGSTPEQLRRIGEELAGAIAQQYAYHRIVAELKRHHLAIIDESIDEQRTVRIRVRNSG